MRHEFQEEESGVFGLGGWAACRDEIIRKQSNENKTKKKPGTVSCSVGHRWHT